MTDYFFRIDKSFLGLRIDQFLVKKLPIYSRAYFKKQIRQGNILVNGQIKKPSYLLRFGDEIKVKIARPEKISLKPDKSIKLKIVYEDKNVIVLDKLTGLVVHPTVSQKADTLVNALLSYYPPIRNVGQNLLRPGIVHRLDKETSGLIVIAKNNSIFDWLKRQFKERKVIKKYLVLVKGKLKEKRGVIAKSIGRAKDFRKRTTLPYHQLKEAITSYKVVKNFSTSKENYTLVKAEPKTGRTHQIRVHFASLGHPVAGDKIYSFKRQIQLKGLKRQFLHASYLKLPLPSGKILKFKSELPEDLKEVLNKLESDV